jgi:hypothetical protein
MANIVGPMNLDELPDYSLFEGARDDLSAMRTIRIKQIMDEEAKPNPDKALIARWDADIDRLREEEENVRISNRAWNIEITMKYNREIRAWYGADEKVAHAA